MAQTPNAAIRTFPPDPAITSAHLRSAQEADLSGLDASSPQALTAHGKVLVKEKKSEEAIAEFRKVVALTPNWADAHLNLGIALADQFNLQEALVEFTEAVRLAPGAAAPHYNRGRVFYDLGRYEDARPELLAAVAADPRIGDAHYMIGMIENQAGNAISAESQFRRAVALMPQNDTALYMLGQSLQRRGDVKGAIQCWRTVIVLNPDYADAYYKLARATAQSNPAESKRLLDHFEALKDQLRLKDRAQTLGNFALAAAADKDWPRAISQLREAIAACGDCLALPVLHKDLGLIYCKSGDWNSGLAELLQAQKLAPEDPELKQSIQVARNALR